ncbi:MAG TPA: glycosyltransferase 87 family protein [Acidimicrobiales bacterium]|nr:glycosyltransferase 87 family protein [Acidimicrobiales bacterium]
MSTVVGPAADSHPEPAAPSTGGSDGDRAARWVPVAWIVGAVSTGLVVVAALGLSWHRRQLDIAVYLMGAHHLLDGHLYLAALPAPPHLPFTYPPFAALVFAPLTVLPLSAAQVLWSLVNVAALFALVWLSLRATRPGLDRRRRLLWSLVLMAPAFWIEPVHLTFAFGQVNVVLAALALADLTGHLRLGTRTLPRGVLIGVVAAVKLTPLVFVPYLFVTRQTRAAWVALGTFALCSGATAATDPGVSWSYWTKYATDAKRVGGVFFISNQSLRAVADRVDHRVVSTGLITLASAVVLVMGIALAGWAWRSSSNLLGVLVCATTGLLVSPITWEHHMVWIVPVLIWLVWAPDRPAGGRLWALAGAALFFWAPIWKVPHGSNVELTEHGWQLLEGNSFFLAMVVFMVGVAVLLTVRRPEPGPGVAAQATATTVPVQDPLPAGQAADPAAGSVTP